MSTQEIYITANPTPNPDALKFIVDRPLVDGDPVSYQDPREASGSPLAEKLFALDGVKHLFAFQNFITVTKDDDRPWQEFARAIGKTIREHLQSGDPKNFSRPQSDGSDQQGDEKVQIIQGVLDEVRPMVAMDGGNIVFAGYRDGVVQLFMQGSCSGCPSSTLTLKAGIENRLKEVLPEVKDVVAI